MQNYLSTTYRRMHDKIKEVRRLDFKGKLPKSMTDVKMILNGLTPSASVTREVTKFPHQLTSRIIQFPYAQYWRKYWLVNCTITAVLFMPTFYNLYKANNAERYEQFAKKDVNEIRDPNKQTEHSKV